MKISSIGAVITLALGTAGIGLLPDPDPITSIDREEMRRELSFLASDEMRGRDVATSENLIATRYLAYRFEEIGLQPAWEGSYLQRFTLIQSSLGERNSLRLQGDGAIHHAQLRDEFYPNHLSASGRAEGRVIFAGYGITAPDLNYDDYDGLDVRGKVVLVVDHEPGENEPTSAFEGLVLSDYGRALHKISNAQLHGASAVLLATDQANHEMETFRRSADRAWPNTRSRGRYELQARRERIHIPAVHISAELAGRLIGSSRRTVAELQEAWEKQGSKAVPIPDRVVLETELDDVKSEIHNVLGLLPGSDQELRDQAVVVGAHLDHVSGRNRKVIFNGADDNASGTVAVLQLAEAFARSTKAPRRSLLFAHFNAEEKGLLGSYYYSEFPVFPLEKTVAMLQMDMIGRNEEVSDPEDRRFRQLEVQTAEENRESVNILGATRSRDLRSLAEEANLQIGLRLRFRYDNHPIGLLRRSDHWPFLAARVPVLFFHTGLHPDYHRPTDTADRINFEKMEKIVRLVYLVTRETANSSQAPHFTPFETRQ